MRRYIEPPLDGPPMTDADLDLLFHIPDLKRVDLGGTRVSNTALQRVRRALPSVEIEAGDRPDRLPEE
jgi:hypothetical protein